MIHIKETAFKGVYVAESDAYADHRGCFMERFRLDAWEPVIGPAWFVQENESLSIQGVLRGLHYQLPPYGQAKLVWVAWGAVRDVVVDMRPHSLTFGQYRIEELNVLNRRQLYIPAGFAHGFLTLSPEAVVQYKVDAPYVPAAERTLRFDDPFLRIDWGMPPDVCVLSDKDRLGLLWEAAMIEIMNIS